MSRCVHKTMVDGFDCLLECEHRTKQKINALLLKRTPHQY